MLSIASTVSAASLTLAWDPATDDITTGYVVYYGTTSRVYTAKVDVGDVTSFVVTGLAENTKYFVVVRAYDDNGLFSDPSDEVSGFSSTTIVPPPPPPPRNVPGNLITVTAVARDRFIDVSWVSAAVPGTTGYRVEVGTAANQTAFSAVTTTQLSVSFDRADLPTSKYYVRVRRMLGPVLGDLSNEQIVTVSGLPIGEAPRDTLCVAAPGAPRQFIAESGLLVHLAWQRGGGDAPTAYLLQVGTAPGRQDLMTIPFTPDRRDLLASAANGTYYLRMAARNDCGVSTWGPEAILAVGSLLNGPPGAPQTLRGQVSNGTVTLTWSAPTTGGAPAYYVIEVVSSPFGAMKVNTGGLGTTFSNPGTPRGVYVLQVRAANSAGQSAASNRIAITVW